MAGYYRWNEQDRYRGFGGERSRYEGLGDPGAHGAEETGDDDRAAWDRPYGHMGAVGYGTESRGGAGRMGRYEQGSYGHASRAGSDTHGPHRGRGPRGYQRSDERIREEVSDRLWQHPEIDASDIEVKVKNGEVTLTGTVDERWTKRMVEDVVESCMGVRDVTNQLKVRQESGQGWQERANQQATQGGTDTSSDATQSSRAGSTTTSRRSSSGTKSRTATTESNGSANDRANDRQPANSR
jgi:hypothetical protein